MNILLLAPHPFYQERGTPIAVDLLLQAYARRGATVDVLTYHEGTERAYPGVAIRRIRPPAWVRRVPPGLSWKKIVCDVYLQAGARRLARTRHYDCVHAVEEAVFVAMGLGRPYIFDMDSSMPRQIADKYPALRVLTPLMNACERRAARGALAVVAMCEALARQARENGAPQTFVLRDVSLLPAGAQAVGAELKAELGLHGLCFMYIGNLEPYQGIDLLLKAFAGAVRRGMDAELVIAGGAETDIRRYRTRMAGSDQARRIHFLGPQPVAQMPRLFASADVLVSPRMRGTNTPMKIYSYLHSGKAVLATDLPTHTQVLNPGVARLVQPDPQAFAAAMIALAGDVTARAKLGAAARALAEQEYTPAAFARQFDAFFDWLQQHCGGMRKGA